MSDVSYRLSVDEINYLAVATLVTAAGFTAFSGVLTLKNAAFYLAVSLGVLLSREFGQRTIAQWMDADVTLNLSMEGSSISLVGALTSVITGLPVILLFPVSSSFSIERYEQWGKGVDAMWSKRQAWIANGGIWSLVLSAAVLELASFTDVANAFWIFSVFQLLPFDYSQIPTGTLDGAYILRENGFTWIVLFSISLLGAVLL